MTNYEPGPTAVDGPSGVRPSDIPITGMAFVSPEYFRVTRIPIVRGRGFDATPGAAAGEIIVNQTLARRLWPNRDPIGARLRFGDGADAEWLTVVGIAGDVRMPGGRAAEFFGLQMYRPAGEGDASDGSFLLRVRGDPATVRSMLARAVERAGVGTTLRDVTAAESTLEYAYRAPRYALSLFGGIRESRGRPRGGGAVRHRGLRRGSAHTRDRYLRRVGSRCLHCSRARSSARVSSWFRLAVRSASPARTVRRGR